MSELKAVARELARAAAFPATVYLFGSYARGEATPNSDVDILVVERGLYDWLPESVRLRRVARGKLEKPIDLVVMSNEDWTAWRDHYGTVQHVVASEGVRLAG